MQLTFITKNKDKWNIAKTVLEGYGVTLEQEAVETPEIQHEDVAEIAKYSALYAAKQTNKMVIKTDAGYYIEGLNGFPGPYIKFINKWLTPEDVLKMMENKENKRIEIRETIALAMPNGEYKLFTSSTFGKLVDTPQGNGSLIDRILQRDGQDKVQGLIPGDEMLAFWTTQLGHFHELGKYLQDMSKN